MRSLVPLGGALTMTLLLGAAHAADYVSRAEKEIKAGDVEGAVRSLQNGAREGDMRCHYLLGMWALSGTHLEQDPAAAARWLEKPARAGFPMAQSSLGLLYAAGLGVEQDASKAAEWYREAADYGDPLGQAALGAAQYSGEGVARDRVEGYMWTSLAAAQGSQKALANLAAMEREMSAQEIDRARALAKSFEPKKLPASRDWMLPSALYVPSALELRRFPPR